MKTIWKFPLGVVDEQVVAMPAGAQVLSVQAQHGVLCLWALVDPNVPFVGVTIRIYGTGHPMNIWDSMAFIGTVQVNGGLLVWHVFKKEE